MTCHSEYLPVYERIIVKWILGGEDARWKNNEK
jgi:hypothetical protein